MNSTFYKGSRRIKRTDVNVAACALRHWVKIKNTGRIEGDLGDREILREADFKALDGASEHKRREVIKKMKKFEAS